MLMRQREKVKSPTSGVEGGFIATNAASIASSREITHAGFASLQLELGVTWQTDFAAMNEAVVASPR